MADRTRSDHEVTEAFDAAPEDGAEAPVRPDGSADTVPGPGMWKHLGDDDTIATGEQWGHYRIVEFLGSGGMGVVYRAQDLTLDRDVAIKFLKGEQPQLVQRFFREARAQARIDHEGICAVYEAGELEGRSFIAMQYLDGKPLNEAVDDLTLDQRVRLMVQVVEAVQAAHSQGLVHRDLKPGNIIVVETAEGELKPYVMDFGLVRDEQAPNMTATGATLGTPAYMAPEQARGETERIDRRTDVYSLGATLHDVLIGIPPFPETNPVRQLIRVLEEDPKPLRQRDPHVPADLETIALRCLEKEPEARYPSAKALADELHRYLDGEPIEARPISGLQRLVRRLRKQRALATVVAVAVVVVLLTGAAAWRVRWQSAREAELAQEFGQAAADIEWIMRVAHMSPLHDVSREQDQVRARMEDVETRMQEVGRLGQGPGHHALGRGYLELGEVERAREHLERAWEAGYQSPEVAYALGSAYGQLYERELRALGAVPDPVLQASQLQQVQEEYREPAVRYLKASQGADLAAPEILEGRIALYEGRHDEALALAQQAAGRQAWLYEAMILEGAVHGAVGTELRRAGEYEGSLQRLGQGIDAYGAAVAVGESDAAGYHGLCEAWLEVMRTQGETDPGGMRTAMDGALEACDKALTAEPGRTEARIAQARAWRAWAGQLQGRGEDPEQAYGEALAAIDGAIQGDPQHARAHQTRGSIHAARASYVQGWRGEDPTADLDAAIASYRKASELDPDDAAVALGLGTTYRTQAKYQWHTGGEPDGSWASAIEAFERSLALDPEQGKIHNHLGALYADRACYRNEHGSDPGSDLERSIAAFQLAVERNPNDSFAHCGIGATYYIRAEIEVQQGQDPRASSASCVQAMGRSIEIKPSWDYPHFSIGFAHYLAAYYELMAGEDPSTSLDKGRSALQVAVELNPGSVNNWLFLGELELLAAEYALRQDRSPQPELAEIDRLRDRGVALAPDSSQAERLAGDAAMIEGRWRARGRRSPLGAYGRAEGAFARALEGNPKDSLALVRSAMLRMYRAEWSLGHGAAAEPDLSDGLAFVRSAREINARDAEAVAVEGALLLLQAQTAADEAARTAARQDGEAAIRRAIEMNPLMEQDYGARL